MKGLMIKDLCIFKQQKNTMLIMLGISTFLAVTGNETSFVVSYLSLLAATLAIGTITYDDFGNGLSFLFTLPASRTDYIKEKYVFSISFTTLVWGIATVLTSVVNIVMNKPMDIATHMGICGLVLGIVFLTISIMVPIHIKYGAEKSRVVLILVMGIIAILVFLGSKIGDILGFTKEEALSLLNQINVKTFIAVFVLCILLFIAVSFRISIKIIMKKEF